MSSVPGLSQPLLLSCNSSLAYVITIVVLSVVTGRLLHLWLSFCVMLIVLSYLDLMLLRRLLHSSMLFAWLRCFVSLTQPAQFVFWPTPRTMLLGLYWNSDMTIGGIRLSSIANGWVLLKAITLRLNVNFLVVCWLSPVGNHTSLGVLLSWLRTTALWFTFSPSLSFPVARLAGWMSWPSMMYRLCTHLDDRMWLLMPCRVFLLPRLVLLSLVLGTTPCFVGEWWLHSKPVMTRNFCRWKFKLNRTRMGSLFATTW